MDSRCATQMIVGLREDHDISSCQEKVRRLQSDRQCTDTEFRAWPFSDQSVANPTQDVKIYGLQHLFKRDDQRKTGLHCCGATKDPPRPKATLRRNAPGVAIDR